MHSFTRDESRCILRRGCSAESENAALSEALQRASYPRPLYIYIYAVQCTHNATAGDPFARFAQ